MTSTLGCRRRAACTNDAVEYTNPSRLPATQATAATPPDPTAAAMMPAASSTHSVPNSTAARRRKIHRNKLVITSCLR